MNPLVLIGPPGAGKSTIGKALARAMDLKFIDTDQEIERKIGKKIAEIFLEDGEIEFRKIEKDVVLEALKEVDAVISLGGGSVLDLETQERLKELNDVVFLDVSISNAAPRVGFNRERPLLLGNPRQQWLQLMEKRRPIYETLAKKVVSTDNRKVNEVVAELVGEFKA